MGKELGGGRCGGASGASAISSCPVINGRYVVEELIGRGGYGWVFRARDKQLDTWVALKFVPETKNAWPVLEARYNARTRSRHVARPIEIFKIQHPLELVLRGSVHHIPPSYCLVMEFVKGGTLRDCAHELTLRQALSMLIPVLRTLEELHHMGVLHLDIKPSNIVVEQGSRGNHDALVLLDLGLSNAHKLSITGGAGTLHFGAPEQLEGRWNEVGPHSDVYSVGAIIEWLLQNTKRGEESSALSWIAMRELEAVIAKCKHSNPKLRYQTVGELIEDLERWLAGEPIRGGKSGVYRLLRLVTSPRIKRAILVSTLLCLLEIAAWFGWRRFIFLKEISAFEKEVASALADVSKIVEDAMLAPPHDVTNDWVRAENRIDELVARFRNAPKVGKCVLAYGIGKGLLMRRAPERAIPWLRTAWDCGYRSDQVALSVAEAYVASYEQKAAQVCSVLGGMSLKQRLSELKRALLNEADHWLSRASPGCVPALLEARLAAARGNLEELSLVLKNLDASLDGPKGVYRKEYWRGYVSLTKATGAAARGEKTKRIEEAIESFARAARIGESDPRVVDALCRARVMLIQERIKELSQAEGPSTILKLMKEAEADCSKLGVLLPASSMAPMRLAELYLKVAEWEHYAGLREADFLENAIRLASKATEADPYNPEPKLVLVAALRREASCIMWVKGEDPSEVYRKALPIARELVKAHPRSARAHHALGVLFRDLADVVCHEFPDNSPAGCAEAFLSAEAELTKASELDGTFAVPLKDLSYVLSREAFLRMWTWPYQEVKRLLDKAEQAARKAAELEPCYYDALDNLGESYLQRGRLELLHGHDPTPWLEKAIQVWIEDYNCAPARTYSQQKIEGTLVMWRWLDLVSHGRFPGWQQHVRKLAWLKNLAQPLPKSMWEELHLSTRVEMLFLDAWSRIENGLPPLPQLEEVSACSERVGPGIRKRWMLVLLRFWQAFHEASEGHSPVELLKQAESEAWPGLLSCRGYLGLPYEHEIPFTFWGLPGSAVLLSAWYMCKSGQDASPYLNTAEQYLERLPETTRKLPIVMMFQAAVKFVEAGCSSPAEREGLLEEAKALASEASSKSCYLNAAARRLTELEECSPIPWLGLPETCIGPKGH